MVQHINLKLPTDGQKGCFYLFESKENLNSYSKYKTGDWLKDKDLFFGTVVQRLMPDGLHALVGGDQSSRTVAVQQ